MDVTVSDIQELLPHVKHADVFVWIHVHCRNRNRCRGPNPEKSRGRPVRRTTCACRWRRGLRDEGTSLFTGPVYHADIIVKDAIPIRTCRLGQMH